MLDLIKLILAFLVDLFRSRAALEAEVLVFAAADHSAAPT
jgi:hypothetical protein